MTDPSEIQQGNVVLTFSAIDFETANRHKGSICAAGVVRVVDGKVEQQEVFYVRPAAELSEFEFWNTRVHGIRAADVASAPEWPDVYRDLRRIIGDDVVVAHNAAGADYPMMSQACALYDLAAPAMPVCTMKLAKRFLQLPSYRLPNVTEALGIDAFDHHDAAADALAAAHVVLRLAEINQARSVEELVGLQPEGGVAARRRTVGYRSR